MKQIHINLNELPLCTRYKLFNFLNDNNIYVKFNNKSILKNKEFNKLTTYVYDLFNITILDFNTRNSNLIDAHFVLSFILRNKYKLSFQDIATTLNCKAHATIINHLKKFENLYKTDKIFKFKVDDVNKEFNLKLNNKLKLIIKK